jgi:hypothetical protein
LIKYFCQNKNKNVEITAGKSATVCGSQGDFIDYFGIGKENNLREYH